MRAWVEPFIFRKFNRHLDIDKMKRLALCVSLALAVPSVGQAAPVSFVNNYGGNSGDWATYVSGTGATVDGAVAFNTHPTGALIGNFYAGFGVTMSASSSIFVGVADYTAGFTGTATCPCSVGEGMMPFSRVLLYGDQVDLTVNFTSPVSGFGLFMGDKFDPSGTDPVVMKAWSGQGGTGTELSSLTLTGLNFQNEVYQVFLGFASTVNEIGSVTLSDGYSATGDGVNLDNFNIARLQTEQTVPAPAALTLLGIGLGGLALARNRRKAALPG